MPHEGEVACHLQCHCDSERQTDSRLDTESHLMFFPDSFNIHEELGEERLTGLKINCVLRETSAKKNLSRGMCDRLKHINLSVNFTLHVHEIRQGFLYYELYFELYTLQ